MSEKEPWFLKKHYWRDDYGYLQSTPWTPLIGGLQHRAEVWKRAAKKWREEAEVRLSEMSYATRERVSAEATATRLRGLLRRCDYIFEIYNVDKEDVRDRFDSTLFGELAAELKEDK